MRTTLDIDDDVLSAAKELAGKENKTAGKILSEYFRRGLQRTGTSDDSGKKNIKFVMKNGIPVLPPTGEIVTVEKVRRIMEEEGI
jgi:hypothetical protein